MPSLANSNAGAMSTKTWGQAKAEVAQVVGADPEVLEAAEAQISAVLEDWNTRRNWQFLQVLAPDITVTGGTSVYDLPSTFKKPYAALLVTNARTLTYITRRQYNLVDPDQVSMSVPDFYTLFNVGTTGQIELLPANGANDTLRVWYYRLMKQGPTSDEETLDVLGRYTNYVLDGARARLIGLRGPVEKLAFWKGEAEAGFMKAQADDEGIPDEDVGFQPLAAHTTTPSLNSFRWAEMDW